MKRKRRGVTPIQVLPIGFLVVILIGTLMLMLPQATAANERMPFADALFTATSASCVTGLIVADTGTYFSAFGQAVILFLIQLGGLGFMTMSTVLFFLTGRRVSLRDRMNIAEGLGAEHLQGVMGLCKNVLAVTAVCEGAGALLLAIRFVPQYGFLRGVWHSVFTSVSAFCNAGFDLVGGYRSLMPYQNDPLVLGVVSALIVIGGLGFVVVLNLLHKRRFAKLNLHAKLVVSGTVLLLLAGTVAVFALEFNNPATLGPMDLGRKALNAAFQSVTLRTAGFNSIDQFLLRDATKGVGILLMLVGGAPAGTAGGLKVTTMLTLALVVRAYLRGENEVRAFERTIAREQQRRAIALLFCALGYLMFMTIGISAIEQGRLAGEFGIWNQLYEATSALCTVGVSVGVTGAATIASRMMLVSMMYVGRVGLLTVAMALAENGHQEALIRYPEESVMIG